MTYDVITLAENLVRDMARREASALTSTADRLPDLAVRSVVCPCGAVAEQVAGGPTPMRTGRVVDLSKSTPTADDALPLLTKLACERFDNRALLPVAVALLRHPNLPIRLRTRAVALRESADSPSASAWGWPPRDPQRLLLHLRWLNDDEAWWPTACSPAPAGTTAWTLPVTTCHTITGPEVRGATFLGPHGYGPELAQLNKAYLRNRMNAVLKAL